MCKVKIRPSPPTHMPKELPIATQRRILKLEQRVFRLEQQIARAKTKYEKQIGKLKEENHKLRTQPLVMTEERRAELIERHHAALSGDSDRPE